MEKSRKKLKEILYELVKECISLGIVGGGEEIKPKGGETKFRESYVSWEIKENR